jgi:hypothetical protein
MSETTQTKDTVAVRITATERVRYSQVVKMPRAEFERLTAALEDDATGEEAELEIEDVIDHTDPFDSDEFEVIAFEEDK